MDGLIAPSLFYGTVPLFAIAQTVVVGIGMLSWDDFRYVKAIADTRSLAGAAEELGVNHSTVFRRLGQIEQQLGSRLFERGRAGYALTPCGEEMVRLAERMGEDIIAFERKVTGQDLRPSGELRVTTSDMVLLHLLTGVLVGFRRAYPEIVLDLVVSNRIAQSVEARRRRGGARHLSAAGGADRPRVARIAWAVFGPTALAPTAVRSRDRRGRARLDRLRRPPSGRAGDQMAQGARDQTRIVYKVNTLLGLAEAAAGGIGLALLPCFIGDAMPGLARLCAPIAETRRRAVAAHAPRPAQHGARARVPRLLRRRDRQAAQKLPRVPGGPKRECGPLQLPTLRAPPSPPPPRGAPPGFILQLRRRAPAPQNVSFLFFWAAGEGIVVEPQPGPRPFTPGCRRAALSSPLGGGGEGERAFPVVVGRLGGLKRLERNARRQKVSVSITARFACR